MKPRAGQNQIRSPCPRAPARPHVRLSDTTRTGRAAEDVGPYHPSCPDAARRAKDPRRPGAWRPNGPGARSTRAASAPGRQEVEGAPRAGTVSWWTKKPLSPDAEEMEQGRRGRVEEFYDGIEKGRRNEGQ